jgi:hypothetical protein
MSEEMVTVKLPRSHPLADLLESQGLLNQAMALRFIGPVQGPDWTGKLACPGCGNEDARQMWWLEDVLERREIYGTTAERLPNAYPNSLPDRCDRLLIADMSNDEFDSDRCGNDRLGCRLCDMEFPIPKGLKCEWIDSSSGEAIWPENSTSPADPTMRIAGLVTVGDLTLRVVEQYGFRTLQEPISNDPSSDAFGEWVNLVTTFPPDRVCRNTWERYLSYFDEGLRIIAPERRRPNTLPSLLPLTRALEAMGAGPRPADSNG